MESTLKFPFYAKASLTFIGLFAFVGMLSIAQGIILPLIYATILAIVLNPIVNFLVKRKINRALAITITMVAVISTTVFVIILLFSKLIEFSDSFPKLVEKFHQFLDQSIAWASDNFNISTRKINVWVTGKNAEIMSQSSSVIGQTIVSTGNLLVILVLIPVYIFMILFYHSLLIEFIYKLFKSSNQSKVSEVVSATKKIIQSYLVGLLLEALIVAVLNVSSLLIIGIDYAILLGIIGAVLNIIPYLGGLIAVALTMIVALVTKSPTHAALVLASFIFIQFIDNNFIIPRVVGSRVKLNALVSVIIVIVGGALWGLPGMFLSIPLTAILKVICDHIEPLKPWGFLLGDIVPTASKYTFSKKNN